MLQKVVRQAYSRIIFPAENEKLTSLESYNSTSIRIIHKIYTKTLYVGRIRVRLTHNISTPLIALLFFPALLILSLVFLLLTRDSKTGSLLPGSRGPPSLREINSQYDQPFVIGCVEPQVNKPRENAVLVVLARNSEVEGVTDSMKSLERHFNRWFHYPYVFLNDESFNSTFIEAVQNVTDSSVEFGIIDQNDWNFPDWADSEDIEEAIAQQGDRAIMYGAKESYHKMCRFYSGKFFNHPLLLKYEWYWRVEPDVKYFCDITYDPFVYMKEKNKVYGFTIIIKELVETVPNLFRHTVGFKNRSGMNSTRLWDLFIEHEVDEELDKNIKQDSGSVRKQKKKSKQEKNEKEKQLKAELEQQLPPEALLDQNKLELEPVEPNAMNGEIYNMCHFWSNFEIARLDFFRSKEYNDYFEALDKTGGFWSERWGDAPIHSLATGLFLQPEQIHYFRDIGYRHTTIQHCPGNAPLRQRPYIPFIKDAHDKTEIEIDNYWAKFDSPVTNGVGCRCRCDTDIVEVEGKDGSCLNEWVELVGGWV